MKVRTIVILTVLSGLLLFAGIYSQAAYLPNEKSMITDVINEGDAPRLIKELIGGMKDKLEKDADNFPALISEVENFAENTADVASAALLHSMAAEMYHLYYQQNRWKIDRRTPIVGYVPEDIREWTSNLFTDKIEEELNASLQPAAILQQTPVSVFKEVIEAGKHSPDTRPTVYDFLAYRAIDIRPSDEIFTHLLSFRQAQPDKKATLFAELDYLRYTYNKDYSSANQAAYRASLDSLMSVYGDKDYSVEIVLHKLEALHNTFNRENQDSIRGLEYRLCQETIARFPRYERIGMITNWLTEMEETSMSIESNNTVYPGRNLELKLHYKNISHVNIKIYRSLKSVEETVAYHYDESKKNKPGKLVKEASFTLEQKNTYTFADTTLHVPVDEFGLYEYVISAGGRNVEAKGLFSVSRLATVTRRLSSGQIEVLVTDFLTGKPVTGATVSYYEGGRNKLVLSGIVESDKDGLALLPWKDKTTAYRVSLAKDTASFATTVYSSGNRYEAKMPGVTVSLLTDRGIYRPGQAVYFKGIAYNNGKENPKVITNKRFEVILRDVNYEEVSTRTFSTNAFGSFTGEFVLPRQALNGMFTLATENGSVHFRVEEYKRPTFKVDILPVKEDVTFGDEVTVHGKAQTFSGVALQSGDITYRVVRRPFWLRMYTGHREEQVAEGKTTVNADGTFSFSFRLEKSETGLPFSYNTFDVITLLTDSKGESQEARSSFSVGDRSLVLSTTLPAQVNKEAVHARIEAKTLNGEEIPVNGTYTIVTLEDTGDKDVYTEGKEIFRGDFSTTDSLPETLFSKLPSGRLRIKMSANDSKGRPVEQNQDFILYGKSDKRPPVFRHTWVLKEKTVCSPGEEAEIIFGTSDQEAYILYELFHEGKNVSRRRMMLSNENQTFKIPFSANYRNGVVASFTFVKEGKLHTEQILINRKQPDRSLTIRPETFRDKLLPGSQESWTFRITDKDSLAVDAEVLASMYDASLDKIVPFNWYFSPVSPPNIYFNNYHTGGGFGVRSRYLSQQVNYPDVPMFVYDRLDWQGALYVNTYSGGGLLRLYSARSKSAAPAPEVMAVSDDSAVLEEEAVVGYVEQQVDQATGSVENGAGGEGAPDVQLRTNFNETAFFYPTLYTDKEGDIHISFTIPESNTTWKLQTLAHTPDLKHGLSKQEVVTQKPLMVLPNLPRFMRQGDRISISTQVMNLSEKEVAGSARLEWFDPANEKPLAGLAGEEKPFRLAVDGSTVVNWSATVPQTTGLIGCRIIADSETASDGEQHILPVLSNEILVTESTPFYLLGQGKKQVNLAGQPSATRRPYSMTLEYSSNPVWYAVQALPTVEQPDNDNIISWFASYYTNTLAMSVAASNPKIKKVIDQWAAQGGTASTLLSNLEKNEELKSVLLEETPWVLEAKTETEQKQRLSLLFDVNRAGWQREAALRVLLEQQTDEGAWGWFKGFYPNRGITTYILNGMAQLVNLNAVQYNQQEKEMQIRALQYLDKSIQKEYEWLKKSKVNLANYTPSQEQVDFLYVRSSYRDIPEWGDAREAIRYFTNQAEKQWEKASLYGKGKIAILMHRNGKKEASNNILAWLRKTATTSEEKGMYWANNRRGSSFFVSPIDVHSLLAAAFNELAPGTEEADRLKQWLLNQKRTQNWESVPTTVNAVYSLLSTGTDWLDEDNKSTLQWGGKTFDPPAGETATGYIKEVVQGKDITPSMQTVTIHKEGKAPAWGAVYNQYFESVENVVKQKGALHVEKKLFIETNSGKERQIAPVPEGKPLRVGDKVVVRLTIRSDRDMEYVSLKDLRAGCFEPNTQKSGSMYLEGIRYYRSPKDVSENFYFDHLPAGTHVLEYEAYVSRNGEYAGGIATIQCMYAPEFVSHTGGMKLTVRD